MKKKYILFLFTLFLLYSCVKSSDFNDIKINVSTSMPVGTISLDHKSLFNLTSVGDIMKIGHDDMLCFEDKEQYNISTSPDEILQIPNQQILMDYAVNGLVVPPGESAIIPENEAIDYMFVFPSNDVEINELILNSGDINFTANADNYAGVKCTIPQITKDGIPVSMSPGESLALDDTYKIILPKSNFLNVVFSGVVKGTNVIKGEVSIDDLKVKSAKGFFGRRLIKTINTTVNIDKKIGSFLNGMDNFYLSDPSLSLDILNDFNIPIMIRIKSLLVDNKPVDLKNEYNRSIFLAVKGENNFVLNNSSTVSGDGISKELNSSVSEIKLEVEILMNPTNIDLKNNDIITSHEGEPANSMNSTDKAKGEHTFLIPFKGYFKNIIFKKSFKIGLEGEVDANNAAIAVTVKNKFPFDIELDLYANAAGSSSDMLLNSQPILIPGAKPGLKPSDSNFIAGEVTDNDAIIIALNKDAANQMFNAESLGYKISASSYNIANKQIITLFSGMSIDISLSCGLDANMQ